MDGIINFHKPPGISSAAAVARVKRLLPKGVKIGHAGTLDPFASGVLLLLIGKATKLCERLMDEPKQYEATLKLGATSETLDPESQEIIDEAAVEISHQRVEESLKNFVGPIEQRPPAYSALKIAGKPAYKLARAGEEVELEPRTVTIYAIKLLSYQWPKLQLLIDCGRGTYIRSLARDIGQALGTTGYLTALKRTRIGRFSIDQAVTIETLTQKGVDAFLRTI